MAEKVDIKKYHVRQNCYCDRYGNILWKEPNIFRRLNGVGDTFIKDYIEYKVLRVALWKKKAVYNLERLRDVRNTR